jgi:alkylation response protein AidB-like acyl-CoA dehydrogenase
MTATASKSDIIATAKSLQATVRDYADEAERIRHIPRALVDVFHQHRMFDLCLPEKLGGLEVDIVTLAHVLEEIAVADGSAAWAVGIGCGTSIIASYLPEKLARDIFRTGNVSGGAMAPNGRAIPVEGGYRVSGRWPFASGCTHCSWLVGGSLVFENDAPRMNAAGMTDWRTMVFPVDEVEIIDTWHVSGLRGTGSRDMAVKDVFVPEERAIGFFSQRPWAEGPLFRFPVLGFLALTISPIPLGLARRAIDELATLARTKVPMGSAAALKDRSIAQYEVAKAEAILRSARAWKYEVTEDIWDKCVRGDEVTVRDRAMLRAACAHAALESSRAIDMVYTLGGGTSIYETSVLQRCMRDAHAATQHVMLAPANYEPAGRIMFGLEPASPLL